MTHRPPPRGRLLTPSFLLAMAGLASAPDAQATAAPHAPTSAELGLRRHEVAVFAPLSGRSEPALTLDVPFEGRTYLVELEPHSVRSPSFQVLATDGRGGLASVPAPEPRTFRGRLFDEAGNELPGQVAAACTDLGWEMTIDLEGFAGPSEVIGVQPLETLRPGAGAPGLHAVYRASDTIDEEPWSCASDDGDRMSVDPGSQPTALAATAGNRVVEIAFDTDVEFFSLFGSVDAVVQDIENLMNTIELVYERDMGVTYEVTTIIVRTGAAAGDPYTTNDPSAALNEFRDFWNTKVGFVRRDVAHLMTGKNLVGSIIGIASLRTVCSIDSAYGLSQSRFTSFFTSRAALTAHEVGHNLNADHCDTCTTGSGECRIMCASLGGCNGLSTLAFGPCAQVDVSHFLNQINCVPVEQAPFGVGFFDSFSTAPLDGSRWTFNDGGSVATAGMNEPSPPSSLKLNLVGNGPGKHDDVRSHTIDLAGRSDVFLSFFSQHRFVESGEELVVEYASASQSGWKDLVRIASDGVDQTSFVYHRVPLPPDAYHDEFRLRFTVDASFDGGGDSWYVDDVLVSDGPSLIQDPLVRGQVFTTQCAGNAPGATAAFLISAAGTGPGPTLFGGALQLDILPTVFTLGFAAANAQGVATLVRLVPSGFPLFTITTQALSLGANLPDSTKSNVVAQTVTLP